MNVTNGGLLNLSPATEAMLIGCGHKFKENLMTSKFTLSIMALVGLFFSAVYY
jgi:hypothetical protein